MKNFYLTLCFLGFSIPTILGQYTMHQFTYQGLNRQYLLYVPHLYDSTKATPFVLALHGLGDTITDFAGIDMNMVADTANFIFALPQATDDPLTGLTAWNSGAGTFGITLSSGVDDVGFLNAVIDSVASHYNIDQTRLYCTGFSMGGFMTNRIGCELNNRIAAIASVSGTIGNYITCSPTRDIPACHFHGTSDSTVYYTGDFYGDDPEQLVAFWRSHDHCDSIPSSIDTFPKLVDDGLTIVRFVYPNGNYGTKVEFYKVINGTHEWLAEGHDINYSVEIWRFFSQFQWTEQAPSAITEGPLTPAIALYPNPVSNILEIKTGDFLPERITVYDLNGKKVIDEPYTPYIDVHNLNNGMYFVEASRNNQAARVRFIKAE